MHSKHSGTWVCIRVTWRDPALESLWFRNSSCNSHKLLSDADSAGWDTTLWEPLLYDDLIINYPLLSGTSGLCTSYGERPSSNHQWSAQCLMHNRPPIHIFKLNWKEMFQPPTAHSHDSDADKIDVSVIFSSKDSSRISQHLVLAISETKLAHQDQPFFLRGWNSCLRPCLVLLIIFIC